MGRPPPDNCANCGADIPRNARACPECGADERTGWRENDTYDGLDLPDEEDRSNPFTRRTDDHEASANGGLTWYWTAVALALLIGAILYALGLL